MKSTPQPQGIDLRCLRPKESDADLVSWHGTGRQVGGSVSSIVGGGNENLDTRITADEQYGNWIRP
jgi:hypothetical protein